MDTLYIMENLKENNLQFPGQKTYIKDIQYF